MNDSARKKLELQRTKFVLISNTGEQIDHFDFDPGLLQTLPSSRYGARLERFDLTSRKLGEASHPVAVGTATHQEPTIPFDDGHCDLCLFCQMSDQRNDCGSPNRMRLCLVLKGIH